MRRMLPVLLSLALGPALRAGEFRPFADFLLSSYVKVTGDRLTPIPMKSVVFHVATDGVRVRITADGNDEARTTFEIYRSDGVGRQRSGEPTLEVIPGVQAMSKTGGVLRHLRLTRESLTITTFPGVSDHTIVTHAVAIAPGTPTATPKPVPSESAKP